MENNSWVNSHFSSLLAVKGNTTHNWALKIMYYQMVEEGLKGSKPKITV